MARFAAGIAFATTTILSTAMATTQFVLYTPAGDDPVVERFDPIVNPGTISGHVHQVFGANGMSPNMTYDSLLQSDCTNVGSADFSGNAADKSVYWHPSLYMEASDGTGYVRVPTNGHKMYYRDVGDDSDQKRQPFEFPHGFRMVAGDMSMRAAATDASRQDITQWICHNSENGGDVNGEAGGFPTGGVTDCQTYPYFTGTIHFPHCWNGDDFNQEDPTAHVAYPEGDIQAGKCPSSHPIRLPHIFQEHFFNIHSVVDKVKSNSFVLSQGDDTGFGWHADFFSGWEDGAIPSLFQSCPAPYYGNEDVGTCPTFKKFSIPAGDCKLKTTFKEEVDSPGNALPGCNPVTSVNPAPKLAVAALGVSTLQCAANAVLGGTSSGSSDGQQAASSSVPAILAPPASTLITSAVAAAVTPGFVSDANNVVWVTEIRTVTARDAAATPAPVMRRSRVMRN